LLTLVALSAPSALAWNVDSTETGEAIRWDTMPVPWTWVADGAPPLDDLAGAVTGAFDAWMWVDGTDVTFDEELAGDAVAASIHDGINVVWFDTRWPAEESALALASTYCHADGTVLGFDIRVDATVDWSTTGDPDAYDLQAALTHEIGHTLGVEHSDLEGATMFAVHSRGDDWRRVLHDDDERALRHLYGGTLPELDGIDTWTCTTPGVGPVPFTLPIAFGLCCFRRSRKQPTRMGARAQA
jgi:hypothetical protein